MRRALFVAAVNLEFYSVFYFFSNFSDKSSRYFGLATKYCTYSLTERLVGSRFQTSTGSGQVYIGTLPTLVWR